MSEKISISFDDENRIRVLEADKFKQTDQLKNESMEFMKSLII
jgi:intraflagellar transport protein 20